MARKVGTVEEALEAIRRGKVVLVIDDPDRENEGDLVCAAEFATQENVNLMASEAKGLICMPMSGELCDKLELEQMVTNNTDNHCTAFTVSIDHVDTTTGISAAERSYTALKVVEDDAKPSDFRRPGHMFPSGKGRRRACPGRAYGGNCGSVPAGRLKALRTLL